MMFRTTLDMIVLLVGAVAGSIANRMYSRSLPFARSSPLAWADGRKRVKKLQWLARKVAGGPDMGRENCSRPAHVAGDIDATVV
jgi:hypothetical protein